MINKLKSKTINFRRRIIGNIKQVAVESLVISLSLITLAILLTSSIVRVITTGKTNYDTFLEEKEALTQIQGRNQELLDEYEYVNSDEFKRIILRDTLGIADTNERLYRTKNKTEYFDEVKEYLKLREKTNYSDWWTILINIM